MSEILSSESTILYDNVKSYKLNVLLLYLMLLMSYCVT